MFAESIDGRESPYSIGQFNSSDPALNSYDIVKPKQPASKTIILLAGISALLVLIGMALGLGLGIGAAGILSDYSVINVTNTTIYQKR